MFCINRACWGCGRQSPQKLRNVLVIIPKQLGYFSLPRALLSLLIHQNTSQLFQRREGEVSPLSCRASVHVVACDEHQTTETVLLL